MTERAAARVGLATGGRRTGVCDSAATPAVERRPALPRVVGTAVTERGPDRDGRPWFP